MVFRKSSVTLFPEAGVLFDGVLLDGVPQADNISIIDSVNANNPCLFMFTSPLCFNSDV